MVAHIIKPNHIFFSGGPAMPDPSRPLYFIAAAYSQTLYGPKALAIVDKNAKEVFGLYDDNLPFQVRYAAVVKDSADSHRVVNMTNDPNCIGLIAWAHTFHPMGNSLEALKGLRVPLIHVAGSFHPTIPDNLDMDFMNLHQGAHAKREFSNGLKKIGVTQYPILGYMKSPEFIAELEMYGRAAAAVAELKGKKIYRSGGRMENVTGTDISSTDLEAAIGVGIEEAIPFKWYEVMENLSDDEIDAEIGEWKKRYDFADDLEDGGAHRDDFLLSVKQTAAIKKILATKVGRGRGGRLKYAGFTTHFDGVGQLGQLQAMAADDVMYCGLGFGAEGHAGASALLAAQIIMSQGLDGGCSFTEPYVDDPERKAILYSHMAEGSTRIALNRPFLEYGNLGIGPDIGPVRAVFKYMKGNCVLSSLVNHPGQIKIVTTLGDVIDTPLLPNLRNSNGLIKLVNGYEAERRSLELGEHHHPDIWVSKKVDRDYMVKCMEAFAKMRGIGHKII